MMEDLKDGMDSGDVSNGVKLQVFVKGFGRCAAPDCPQILVQDQTKLGECAHIIPRRVGSHPREDYKTPLEDRSKEANLLYLCELHHKVVDNIQLAEDYTVNVLRDWKKQHEEWAAGVTKGSPYLPQDVKDIFLNIQSHISEQGFVSHGKIVQLLDNCKEFLDRHFVNEATVLYSQLRFLLLGANNDLLKVQADLLGAILLIRTEQIPEAKIRLLQIIKTNPVYIEPMLEYIELCISTPELDDDVERIENLARALAKDHPRLLLIDLQQKLNKGEVIEIPDVTKDWTDDVRLNTKFMLQYALVCDAAQLTSERDALIDKWEKELPTSPRPHVIRWHFKSWDLLRSPSTAFFTEQSHLVQELLRLFEEEKEKATAKDPYHLRDQILWLIIELRMKSTYFRITGIADSPSQLRSNFILLINECYFDSFIDEALQEFLRTVILEHDQWKSIVSKIQTSRMRPSQALLEILFLQALNHPELYVDLSNFVESYERNDLSELTQAFSNNDIETVAEKINAKKSSPFSLDLLQAIPNHDMAIRLSELLELDETYKADLIYGRIRLLASASRDKEALELIAKLPLDDAAPFALQIIERISYRNEQWHLFEPAAIRLMNFDIPLPYRCQLHAQLAIAYFEQGDDTNAIEYAGKALSQSCELGETNSQSLLHVLAQAHARKSQFNEACSKFQLYRQIPRSFELLLEEADLLQKSSIADKYEKSLELIIRAFKEVLDYTDDKYHSALLLLIEIDNNGKIPRESEPIVTDGTFIKLDGFDERWFYVGEKQESFGAENIGMGSDPYQAVFGRSLADKIEWPPDKYSNPDITRTILEIITVPAFLVRRAHEAMYRLAEAGSGPVWSVRVAVEQGALDVANLQRFFKDQFKPSDDFFDAYAKSPVPFAFLCAFEGSLTRALSSMANRGRGFIYFNTGVQADIEAQSRASHEVLEGKSCFIDGLSTFMLTQAGLLEIVTKHLPNLGVSTSVIRLLREVARESVGASSSPGFINFVDGNIRIILRDREADEIYRQKFLAGANLLDEMPNKKVGLIYSEQGETYDFDHLLPNYSVDAFRHSQQNDAYMLTDDALLLQAYKVRGETSIPKSLSSLSLIRIMAEKGLVSWNDYFNYFGLLSVFRYHFLPVSIDDMVKVIFTPTLGGLLTSSPQNIGRLNLPLTLSNEYGVDENVAVRVVSNFFSTLILDDSTPNEIVEEIFALTLKQGLRNVDKRMASRVMYQICQQNLQNRSWISHASERKLQLLKRQLLGFSQGITPIIVESSLLLRTPISNSAN